MGYLGTIQAFASDKIPRDFMPCDGRLLEKSQYAALHQLLGTTYGGDGKHNFALPNLTGHVIIGDGKSAEGTEYKRGEAIGTEQVELSVEQMPEHNHKVLVAEFDGSVMCTDNEATSVTPEGHCFANTGSTNKYNNEIPCDEYLNEKTIELSGKLVVKNEGKGESHNNVQPSIGIIYCICVVGLYPTPS